MEKEKIIKEVFESLLEYLPKIIIGIEKNIDLFRQDREEEAVNLLIQVIEGLQWIFTVLGQTTETLKSNGIEVDASRINDVFIELLDGVKNQDYVLVTDLMEYEMLDILKDLKLRLENKSID
ncbi:hypothetical protein EDC18_10789 [Natranaerovirga pectinivora]|uniref:DUF8042 domain-containing protein n=1 Tax=Natranaerovirga pectinivora TaxID=682400 RepID=A0A4R3MM54_9FIRM|nr:hypothetical protein [Natranaerovirga pectinivora]TCT14020.1 hypothetical protein EDC18_10789 [Natranaerovirga pectinivora]